MLISKEKTHRSGTIPFSIVFYNKRLRLRPRPERRAKQQKTMKQRTVFRWKRLKQSNKALRRRRLRVIRSFLDCKRSRQAGESIAKV